MYKNSPNLNSRFQYLALMYLGIDDHYQKYFTMTISLRICSTMLIMDSPKPAENDSLAYKYYVSPEAYDEGDSCNKMVDSGSDNSSVGANDYERNNYFDTRQRINISTSDYRTKCNPGIPQNEYNHLHFVDHRYKTKTR